MDLTLNVLRCPEAAVPESRQSSGGDLAIGRGLEAEWQLQDPERVLSKRHCALEYRGGFWQVRDLSTNGTFLNHAPEAIGRDLVAPLKDGDRLRLGSYEIEVRIASAAAAGGMANGSAGGWAAPLVADPAGPGRPAPDPFSDPFAPPPAAPPMSGFGGASGGRFGSSLLPDDFDPFGDDPPMPDHRPAASDAFVPPRVTHAASPGAALPDDWGLDLDLAAPASRPEPPRAPPPMPPAVSAPVQPGVAAPVDPPGGWSDPVRDQQPSVALGHALAPGQAAPAAAAVRIGTPAASPGAPWEEEDWGAATEAPPAAPPPGPLAEASLIDPFAEEGVPTLAIHGIIEPPVAAAKPVLPAPALAYTAPGAGRVAIGSPAGSAAADAVAILVRAAGLSPQMLGEAEPAAVLEAAGASLRAAIEGIRALLIARADVKREFRIEQTMLRTAGNNPLKFAASDEAALTALLTGKPGARAVVDTVRDLTAHQVATLAATQAAARALLYRLAPAGLEGTEKGGGFLGSREKRLWDAYKALHTQVTEQFEDDFDSAFGKEFARAYEKASGREPAL